MQSFNFNSREEEVLKLERIISQRKQKIAKQQIIYSLILLTILAGVVYYVALKLMYTEFDGYMQTDYTDMRAEDDLYLMEYYPKVGDMVIPGDTLYSYIFLDEIRDFNDVEEEPSIIVSDRNLRLQSGIFTHDADVLKTRITELKKQIARESHNIQFGLSDNSHKMDLERELEETRTQYNSLINKAKVYDRIGNESNVAVNRSGYKNKLENLTNVNLARYICEHFPEKIIYVVSEDTAVVTKLWYANETSIFKSEGVMQLQKLNLSKSHVSVMAYIPTDKMDKINQNTVAEVIVNDDVSFMARVRLLGARTELLPTELRNSLSRVYTVVAVSLVPEPGQEIPFWAVVNNVPVVVRVKNYDNGSKGKYYDYWYLNGEGLSQETDSLLFSSKDSLNR